MQAPISTPKDKISTTALTVQEHGATTQAEKRAEHELAHFKDQAEAWRKSAAVASTRLALQQTELDDLRRQLRHQSEVAAAGNASTQMQRLKKLLQQERAAVQKLKNEFAELSNERTRLEGVLANERTRLEGVLSSARAEWERQAREAQRQSREQAERRYQHGLQGARAILTRLYSKQLALQQVLSRPYRLGRYIRLRRTLKREMLMIAQSGLFDATWYRRTYPDVAAAGIDLLWHFVLSGAYELRDPGPGFSSLAYHLANPDVLDGAEAGLLHYLHHGRNEGRRIAPSLEGESPGTL